MMDEYRARVDFQQELDLQFPKGAWVTILQLEPAVAVGPEMSVGRVFCSGARLVGGTVWWYELFCDGRAAEDSLEQGDARPLRVWVESIDETDGPDELYEAALVDEDEAALGLVVRLNGDPKGAHRPRPGHRAFTTERWLAELFPEGLEVASEDDSD